MILNSAVCVSSKIQCSGLWSYASIDPINRFDLQYKDAEGASFDENERLERERHERLDRNDFKEDHRNSGNENDNSNNVVQEQGLEDASFNGLTDIVEVGLDSIKNNHCSSSICNALVYLGDFPRKAYKLNRMKIGQNIIKNIGRSGLGNKPISNVRIGDLNPIQGSTHQKTRPELQKLTDQQLLDATRNPNDGKWIIRNPRTGTLSDGNGRTIDLQRRTNDTLVPVQNRTFDNSMFWDLD